jgi:hypothetical protein
LLYAHPVTRLESAGEEVSRCRERITAAIRGLEPTLKHTRYEDDEGLAPAAARRELHRG